MEKENNNNNNKIIKLFNLSSVMSKLINFMAYIIAMGSALILIYLSFIDHLDVKIDWAVVTVFVLLAASISWINWNAFYKQRYEKTMALDIAENAENRYSIHARFYYAIKDWKDLELQAKIDEFNKTYTERWLNWVEHRTGYPIETRTEVEVDEKGKPIIDEETGKPKMKLVKGIKDLPYKGFKYPILMWRVKTHHYPQTGYKTAMQVMSLLSYNDANLERRDFNAAKKYYHFRSISRLLSSLGVTAIGASIIPQMIGGDIWGAILRLILALGALFSAIIMGSLNGVTGARRKLSTVEEVCGDLERWADKKPKIPKYVDVSTVEVQTEQLSIEALLPEKDKEAYEVAEQIFSIPKLPNESSNSQNIK